jgi:2-polyprenyl-3-methyl-5-hydroxy-6-metoxy-1,4-benzoquinol methylase
MKEKVQKYYRNRIKENNSNNLLWQVGKTTNGKVVSMDQVEIIIKTIISRLRLKKNDLLLDVGSGNGLLTKEISKHVLKVTGLELTPELIEIAMTNNSANNISYINYDILRFNEINGNKKYMKVYLYEVIQHLNHNETDTLLSVLNKITSNNATIFIGGILDIERKWIFFDSEERQSIYFSSLLSGNELLGTWFYKDFFKFIAKKHNWYVECIPQETNLYTSHYRFDCILQRK